ncbi:MAG: LCP family protein [Actinomycetaceae bacterium]|nr:LCP family protein [Actinomycetaceae bacterium]
MTDLPPSFPPAIPPRRPNSRSASNPVNRPVDPADGQSAAGHRRHNPGMPTSRRDSEGGPRRLDSSETEVPRRPRETPPPSFAPQRRSIRQPAEAPRPAARSHQQPPQHRPAGADARSAGGARPLRSDRAEALRSDRAEATTPPVIPPRRPANRAAQAPLRAPQALPRTSQGLPRPAATPRPVQPHPDSSGSKKKRRISPLKATLLTVFGVPLILTLGLGFWLNSLWSLSDSQLKHVSALSGAPNTAGTTYLIAGSDSRDNADFKDDTEGRRSDTIMLLHKAENGQVSLISIPRDSFVNIPGQGEGKINSAYALGGPPLLVRTVEDLTGLTVDHYVEVGMDGVTKAVDAVDGVKLCLDYDVADEFSQLFWKAGCHHVDGKTALAFARMRYADPEGDIGRAKRQREVISAVSQKLFSKETYTSPARIKKIVIAGASSLTTDPNTKSWELGYLALYFKEAYQSGLTGAPPIASLDYQTFAGSSVLLDPEKIDEFFRKVASGELTPADFVKAP